MDEIDGEDEYQMAFSLAMKKYSTMSRLDSEVQIRRIQSLLQRKGFGFDVIGRVIRELDIHSDVQLLRQRPQHECDQVDGLNVQ